MLTMNTLMYKYHLYLQKVLLSLSHQALVASLHSSKELLSFLCSSSVFRYFFCFFRLFCAAF